MYPPTKQHIKHISVLYNPEVDFWKLVFAVIVFLYHSNKIIENAFPFIRGYISVEFFFIVSGFFMAVKIRSDDRKGLYTPTDRFMKHKIHGIFKVFFAAFLIGFAGREILAQTGIFTAARDFMMSFYEVGFARLYGLIIVKHFNSPTWYISAMLIAMVVLYPLAAKFKRPFFTVASPVITLFCWAFLCQKFGTINVAEAVDSNGFIMAGVIRAFAGLALGLFINECCSRLKEKNVRPSKAGKVIFFFAEVFCIIWILFYMQYAEKLKWKRIYDFGIALVIAVFVFLVFSELTGIKDTLSNLDFSILSKLSLYLYLSHRIATYILIDRIENGLNTSTGMLLLKYAAITICSMLLCRLIVFLIDLIGKYVIPKLKKLLFIQQKNI